MPTAKDMVVIGVTGSIAAYKIADLVSKLTAEKIPVQVILTENGARFVGPQTFLTLSRRPVITSLWESADWKPEHIELATRTRLLVIAPATANILAKMANGLADDALSTFCLSHDGPVLVAPAMNPRMWKHPATQANVQTLLQRGVKFLGPATGKVACGEQGPGRMVEAVEILQAIKEQLNAQR
jgi:phosphopantothenoylcysteine decarboxylase/phosphopantothenate--cysteine ligase